MVPSRGNMRLVDMTTFVTLARLRHFGRTAECLSTTQPAISIRLTAIEREMGARLLNRTGREVTLTPEGEHVLRTFERILSSVDILKTTITTNPAVQEVIRIGVIDSVCSTWLPKLVDSLRTQMPRLKIELTVESTKLLVIGLRERQFDVIFAVDPVAEEDCRSFVACTLQMVWAGSPRIIDPASIYDVADLSEIPIIIFPKETPPYRMVAPYFEDEKILASNLISSNSLYAIINLLIEGFGIAALPTLTIKKELDQGYLYPLRVGKPFSPMSIFASYRSNPQSSALSSVLSICRDVTKDYATSVGSDFIW